MNPEIQQLKDQVRELLDWKADRERNQITYPLDVESLPALSQHYVRQINADIPSTLIKESSIGFMSMAGLKQGSATDANLNYKAVISAGQETIEKQGGPTSSLNGQMLIDHSPTDSSNNSFIYAYRNPLYLLPSGSTITVSSGGTTMTDSTKNWTVNELAGAMIDLYSSSAAFVCTRQIASNTATVVTINGTWPSDVTGGTYIIFGPMFLGSADYPWRQLYTGGVDMVGDGSVRRAIRIGYGPTSGALGIYFGTGSPAGVVSAMRGSLYLRTDGDSTSTLYAKTGNDATANGWSVIT